MANSNSVYKRITNWNGQIIQPINELCENPPGNCDPIDTLEEAEENHLWMKQDIIDVQNKLKELCDNNSFTDPESPQLATVVYIQEIEDAINVGWCECDEPKTRSWLLDTYVTSKTCCSFDRYTETAVDEEAWIQPYLDAKDALIQTLVSYYAAQKQRCFWNHEALRFQDELDQLESELLVLEVAVPPDSGAIAAKQAEITAKQAELTDAETQRDNYKSQAETAMGEIEGHASSMHSAVDAADAFCPHTKLLDFITTIPNTPWKQTDCENESDWQPQMGSWGIFARRDSGQSLSIISGGFTPTGVPYPTNVFPIGSGGLIFYENMGFVGFDSRYTSRGEAEAWCEGLLTEDPYTIEVFAYVRTP